MKNQWRLIAGLVLALGNFLLAQTADDYVSQGRAWLSATNVVAARASFASAVAAAPNHQAANAFLAATRLLALPSQPGGSNFLNRIGLPADGRDIYNWTAALPRDTNGVPDAPLGMSGSDFSAQLRTNILSEIIAAQANLARVTDVNFTLNLTSNETRAVDVTLDYGDILMFRAMLRAAEYFAYTLNSWNLDAQLTTLRTLHTNEQLSLERVLMDHPHLLTFASTNDLHAASLAFQDGVALYLQASQFIRSRPADVTRLFNYDAEMSDEEADFRMTLTDLVNSLNGAVPLSLDTNYSMFLSAHFSGNHSWRDFLPVIRGNSFAMGTLPDPTFGGLVYGVTRTDAENFLTENILPDSSPPIPTIATIDTLASRQFRFPINVAKGRGYVIQVSTNLLAWEDYHAFMGLGGPYEFTETSLPSQPNLFYRVMDRTGSMPPPVNDDFTNRALIPDLNVPVVSYTVNATRQPDEPSWSWTGHTVWWTWTSPLSAQVAVLATPKDSGWRIGVFTGTTVGSLTQVDIGYDDLIFTAQAGVTYQFAVDSGWPEDGGVQLMLSRPPVLTVTSPPEGAVYTAPANIHVSGSAEDPDGSIREIVVESWSNDLDYRISNNSFSFWWTNVPSGNYYLNFEAVDSTGISTWISRQIRVVPANDNFTNASVIAGVPFAITASNIGAGKETGEPYHAGDSGGASVWWSWTPTVTGPVTIQCNLTNPWGYSGNPLLAIYTGTSVSSLTAVANSVPAVRGGLAQVSFTAAAGVTYRIAVDGQYGSTGNIMLQLIPTRAPMVGFMSPAYGARLFGPTNLTITADAYDLDGTISKVDFYSSGSWIGSSSNSPYSMVWSNVGVGSYNLTVQATDNSGAASSPTAINFSVVLSAPSNDSFTNRIVLSGLPVTANGLNIGATRETGEPYHWSSTGDSSVWWTWTAPMSGSVTVSTVSSTFDTVLSVYTGASVVGLTRIANDDDSGGGGTSKVTFYATAGTVYQVAVAGYSSSTGNIWLNISTP